MFESLFLPEFPLSPGFLLHFRVVSSSLDFLLDLLLLSLDLGDLDLDILLLLAEVVGLLVQFMDLDLGVHDLLPLLGDLVLFLLQLGLEFLPSGNLLLLEFLQLLLLIFSL